MSEHTAETDAPWCPLCYDPDGAHLVGTVHTYGPECERRATVAEIAGRVIPGRVIPPEGTDPG